MKNFEDPTGDNEAQQALNNLISKQEASFATQEEADEFENLVKKAIPEDHLVGGPLVQETGKKEILPELTDIEDVTLN